MAADIAAVPTNMGYLSPMIFSAFINSSRLVPALGCQIVSVSALIPSVEVLSGITTTPPKVGNTLVSSVLSMFKT